jgi:D-alanyl-D-alanine carboxypeptidase (penicillin-binding protein 5/6)
VGVKTGTLDAWNLLSAKAVTIGGTTVRMYASVLGQPNDAARLKASRSLYTELEGELRPKPSVAAGTTTGMVETAWGEAVRVVTKGDASVILWNGGAGAVSTSYSLGDHREKGDVVGSLSVDGPLDDAQVALRLGDDIDGPTAWWRLTHPLQLLGLTD